MSQFVFEQASNGGWVFATDHRDIFLFGPDLQDVVAQAQQAARLLERAHREVASGLATTSWEPLPVAC